MRSLFHTHRPALALAVILLIAAALRLWLIRLDAFVLDSDEAVVGLMARHITQGKPIPTFFYGQHYMGSLDALLVAAGFRLLGTSIVVMRWVQAVLYLLALLTGYQLAYAVSRSYRIALMTLLLLGFPSLLGTVYTSITLGGYNEVIILGNVVLLLAWQIAVEQKSGAWRWITLGLAAGLGWWTNGAIVTALLVASIMLLHRFSARYWRGYVLAAAAFFVGSAPWWGYNLQHDWAALGFLTTGFDSPVDAPSILETGVGFLFLGLPALYGLRAPWQPGIEPTIGVLMTGAVLLLLAVDRLGGRYGHARYKWQVPAARRVEAERWIWFVFGAFTLVFFASAFSDSTGRYLMPLWVPAAIGLALGLDRLRRVGWFLPAALTSVLLAAQTASVLRVAQTPGLHTQLIAELQTPAVFDQQVLDFLEQHGYTRGYAGYWTSYRLILRSDETVILATHLPYEDKVNGAISNRYPAYDAIVAAADRVVWITLNFPELDDAIAARMAEAGVRYRTQDFGPYRVYYDLSEHIAPADLGLNQWPPAPMPS